MDFYSTKVATSQMVESKVGLFGSSSMLSDNKTVIRFCTEVLALDS